MSSRKKSRQKPLNANNNVIKTSTKKPTFKDAQPVDEDTMSTDVLISSVLGVVLLVMYVYTLYPSLPGGDSGELIAAAHELGVSHPPGYPLFTMLTWLAIHVIPVGSVAWKVNLLTAVFSSAAGVFLSLTILRQTHSIAAAVLGAGLWCFCRLTWTWSITGEVFGFNNLFITLLLYLMVVFEQSEASDRLKIARLGSFVSALSLCNQHTMVVYVAMVAPWILLELYKQKLLDWFQILQIGLYFFLGLVPYLYLPLSSYLKPGRWTWGDQSTLAGFMKHFLRQEYGTFDLGKDANDAGLLINIRSYIQHLLEEFNYSGVALMLVGIFSILQRQMTTKKKSLSVSIAMMLVYLLFFSWRANLDMENPLLFGVVERFWMQSDCVLLLVAAVGFSDLIKYVYQYVPWKHFKLELVLAVALVTYQIQKNFLVCNQRNNTVIHEFATHLMENMPPNTLLLTKGDLPSNSLRYLSLCENMRPDVKVFDQEVLTYPWSVPMMRKAYPRINFPGYRMGKATGQLVTGETVFSFTTFLDANYKSSPIVVCIGVQKHELSWKHHYHEFPFGPCRLLFKIGEKVKVTEWQSRIHNISASWSHPYESFDERTWETVANNEMWQAKIGLALHLYEMAQQMMDRKLTTDYYLQSYQLYKVAMETNTAFPAYWHKNYALACERLLSLDHSIDKFKLLDQTILSFQSYVDLTPDDPDSTKIKDAILYLKKQRKNLKS